MPESVPVCCPACRREHVYVAPVYPCVCGASAGPRLDPATGPTVRAHRAWEDEWVTVPCASCGRPGLWPRPELGCPCGTVLHPAVSAAPPRGREEPAAPDTSRAGRAGQGGRPGAQPRPVRTARDAVTAALLYLGWLGHRDVRRADQRPSNGIVLAARGLLAQVDPTVRPAAPRDVECLWLTAMTQSADCLYFSLAGYTDEARARAAALGIALFVLGPTGTPQPVNDAARTLHFAGASRPGTRDRDGRTA
ncbi:hypothetical protein [Streptomyces sp. NK08204]|uniref:hypothetical protein n=1 Tax=Streptomyces sp. NK08204 TaxID=2873260 RepID=UPI001CECDAC3|nr:hypothetical protein [Streptomyces sp. NK08204]